MLPHRLLLSSPVATVAILLVAGLAAFAGLQWRDAERLAEQTAVERRLAVDRQTEAERQRQDAERRRAEAERERDARGEALRLAQSERDAERGRAGAAAMQAAAGRAAFAAREALSREDPLLATVLAARIVKAGADIGWDKTPDLAQVLVTAHRDLSLAAAFKGRFARAALSGDGRVVGLLSADGLAIRDVGMGEPRSAPISLDAALGQLPDPSAWDQETADPQLHLVLSSTGARAAVRLGDKVAVVVAAGGSDPALLPCPLVAGPLLFLDDARLLLACGSRVAVYDAEGARELYGFDLGDEPAQSAASGGTQLIDYSPAAGLIATPREVRSADTGDVVFKVATGDRRTLGRSAVTFSADGSLLAVEDDSESGGTVTQIWDVPGQRKLAPIDDQGEAGPPVVLADKDAALVRSKAGTLVSRQLREPDVNGDPETWHVYDAGSRLLSDRNPFGEDLGYQRAYYMPGARAALFVAEETVDSQGVSMAVVGRLGSFRVLRGRPVGRMSLANHSPDGLFLTRDRTYAYLWRAAHSGGKIALPDMSAEDGPASVTYTARAGTYLTGNQVCSDTCRPYSGGIHAFVLGDGRVRSADLTDDRVMLMDDAKRELASFPLGASAAGLTFESAALTADGRCLAVRLASKEGEGKTRLVVWRTDGTRETLIDVEEPGFGGDIDRVIGAQIFLAGAKGRVRIDCGTGRTSDVEPGAEISASGNGTVVKVVRQAEIDTVKTPAGVDLYSADRFERIATVEVGGSPDELYGLDVEEGGRRYIRAGTVYGTPDGKALATLNPDYSGYRFVPGRSEILGSRNELYGQRQNPILLDAKSYETIMTWDDVLGVDEPITYGPGRRYLASGIRWATELPDLRQAVEDAVRVYDRYGLSDVR